MILDDNDFIIYQTDFVILDKKARWLADHVDTLRILLTHIKTNRSSILQPHYGKYKKMLQQKNAEYRRVHTKSTQVQKIIVDSMLFYINLPDDVKSYMKDFVDPLY